MEDFEARLSKIENQLSELFQTISDAESSHNYKVGLEEFKSKHGDKLAKYEQVAKGFNGDDFDIYNAAYDEYNSAFSDVEEDTYIAKLIETLDNKLAAIKAAVADGESTEVIEEKVDEAKEVAEEANAAMEEHGEEHVEEGNKEAETGEEIKDEAEASEESDESEETDDGIDEEEFQKQLEEDYDKYHS